MFALCFILQAGAMMTFCKHVYEDVGAETCPICGKCAHTTNWQKQWELHKEWIASGKAVAQGWWSI